MRKTKIYMYTQTNENISHRLEENIAKNIFDKGLLFKIYKEPLKLNNKKMNIFVKKQAQIRTDTSPKIHRWQISI